MNDEEVTLAAMYILAKRRLVDTRSPGKVLKEWNKFHRCVHVAIKLQVRESYRALVWAQRAAIENLSK